MMQFLIADTFTDGLARLSDDQQKAVKTTVFVLQLNPANPDMAFHKLDRAKDKNFWSLRVGGDLRIIVHRNAESLLLCYVGHHDKAYAWAERRKLVTHPQTGAAQIVEIRETVQDLFVPMYVPTKAQLEPKPPLFASLGASVLLDYGVPAEWLDDVLQATEDTMLSLADHLPGEAAEALLDLATGGKPRTALLASDVTDPFAHPDAQRRFRVMSNVDELERALAYPWEKWTVFLHPEQRQWVEREYAGPARVSGSAGTGKTIVALHRAVYLARKHPDARVLLTTFSDILANALRTKLRRLISNEPGLAERLEVHSITTIGERLYRLHVGVPQIASSAQLVAAIDQAAMAIPGHKFVAQFLLSEWDQIVDAWRIESWDAYREVKRLGRKTRLSEAQRLTIWSIFEHVHASLREAKLTTRAALFTTVAAVLSETTTPVFDFAVVDESQDLGVSHLRFLAALGVSRPNGLFFAGDLGQRIFQQPVSWKALGIDVRGRSRTLQVNYRTSHQIRKQADRLLAPTVSDVDGIVETRNKTISLFNGPPPTVTVCKTADDETMIIAAWLAEHTRDGLKPHELAVFVRSAAQLDRARAALERAGLAYTVLDDHVDTLSGKASICTMHLAKGLEFRAVCVMACDDEVIPLQERIETVTDEADLEDVYNTERHLLYVACTRARDHLIVTGVAPASEFLEDFRTS